MPITLGTNIASLQAQRRLFETGERLSTVFERLASGQRINRASDDAAGLAISDSLRADARVFNQGVRNLNDGISLLSIAESAVQQLGGIVTRIIELSEQSANGTFSDEQREALNNEAIALQQEYNRITETTEYNGLQLLDQSLGEVSFQAGYSQLYAEIGESLATLVGDGTFSETDSLGIGGFFTRADERIGDIDNDGYDDFLMGTSAGKVMLLSNGDGTFRSQGGIVTSTSSHTALLDINGDGNLDLIDVRSTDSVDINLGNGDGTFAAAVSYATAAGSTGFDVGDIDGDGTIDLVIHARTNDELSILRGNGDGTFQAQYTVAANPQPGNRQEDLELADVNGDGHLDVIHTASQSGPLYTQTLNVLLGDGTGNFTSNQILSINSSFGAAGQNFEIGDLNNDGIIDVVTQSGVNFGNGNGTFAATSLTFSDQQFAQLADMNGDGNLDIVRNSEIHYGNGDGTFAVETGPGGGSGAYPGLGDWNNDGVLDILYASPGTGVDIYTQGTFAVSTLERPDLSTQASSLQTLDTMQAKLSDIAEELGTIGAIQSRLEIASSNLQVARENYISASTRILDADIAEESSKLVRNNILQQTAAAVLAQANQQPALALQLLGGIG